MPPKIQIPKEKILDTALELVIREGHQSATIKRLASELGCSTQPISWTFGSMENFRGELVLHGLEWVRARMCPAGDNPLRRFIRSGRIYLDIAFDAPNLLRFLHASRSRTKVRSVLDASPEGLKSLASALAEDAGISRERAMVFFTSMVIYIQGLVSILLDGNTGYSRDTARSLLREQGIACLVYAGIEMERASALLGE